MILRPYRLADFDTWRDVRLANVDWLEKWEPAGPPHRVRYSYEEFARGASYSDGQANADRGYRFGVFEDGALRGQITLSEVSRGAFQSAFVGYWVDGRQAGRGLTPEAVRVVLAFAFGRLRLHRVQAAIIPRNVASIRVVEKVGMRREGLALRFIQINGVWEDHYLYAITGEEWHG